MLSNNILAVRKLGAFRAASWPSSAEDSTLRSNQHHYTSMQAICLLEYILCAMMLDAQRLGHAQLSGHTARTPTATTVFYHHGKDLSLALWVDVVHVVRAKASAARVRAVKMLLVTSFHMLCSFPRPNAHRILYEIVRNSYDQLRGVPTAKFQMRRTHTGRGSMLYAFGAVDVRRIEEPALRIPSPRNNAVEGMWITH